jgi:hypothetical protein
MRCIFIEKRTCHRHSLHEVGITPRLSEPREFSDLLAPGIAPI